MKKKILLMITIVCISLLTGCKDEITDSEKFAEEYDSITSDNYYVYRTEEEIIKILKNGTGIVYLGFPECPWCKAYVPMLNEVADIEGLEKIYYYNIYDDRLNNTEFYQELVSIIGNYLQYDDEGNKRIYVPAVIAVSKGEIVGFDDETSYDTHGFDDPLEYWTEDEVSDLKNKLTEMINNVLDNKCTDCNK